MRRNAALWLVTVLLGWMSPMVHGEEEGGAPPSARAVEALRLLKSEDAFQRQLGFLRLEALREPGLGNEAREEVMVAMGEYFDPEERP